MLQAIINLEEKAGKSL